MSKHYRHLKMRDVGRLFKCDTDVFMCSPHGEEWTFSFKGRRNNKDCLIMYSVPVLINRKKKIRKLSELKTRK